VASDSSWEWQHARQENGFYPSAVFYNGANITNKLLAFTNTGIVYHTHTGTGEQNYSWNYSHFHPSDDNDWLGYPGNDEIITNTKFFGNDVNTFNDTVKKRYMDWGWWLADQIGFDGFRLDFVRGFQEDFAGDWIKNLPELNGRQRFIVGEYWGAGYRIEDWVNNLAAAGADADAFDFPLKYALTEMCNRNGSSFDMKGLNHAGIIRNNTGNSLPGTSVVTFAENHDTGKEHDKWITRDHKLAYAYILTHEGRPCIFYSHYYGVTQADIHNNSLKTTAPPELQTEINKLIHLRKNYLGGKITVLSETGNPFPAEDTYNVYAARREGNGERDGAVIVINNHDSLTKGIWVNSSPQGFSNWADSALVDAWDINQSLKVEADGRVFLSAPPRSYKIWVKQGDYLPYTGMISVLNDSELPPD
jgi:alpha-amylase